MKSEVFTGLEDMAVRKFVKGVDFDCPMSAFRRRAGNCARKRNCKAATKKMSETEILVQFYPIYRGPTILCSPLAQCLN